FAGDLYGKRMRVDLVARVREERKFPSLDALVAQIRDDAAQARRILA
ncbi:MAG: riboflavin kinase, partial [Myxococcota bacterium]